MQCEVYSADESAKAAMNDRIKVVREEGDEAEALRIATELGISIFIDRRGGHTGAFFMNENGERSPVLKESFQAHGGSMKATLEALCRSASLLVNGAGTEAYPWK